MTPISIDVGLLERSSAVAVVTGRVRLGRRRHLAGARPGCGRRTRAATCVVGRAVLHESHDCIVWADGDPVVLCGVQDLVVVQANGRILVMPTERAAAMKQLLDALPPEIRDIDA